MYYKCNAKFNPDKYNKDLFEVKFKKGVPYKITFN